MALEILGNAIRITAEDNTNIEAIIKDSSGTAITQGNMRLVIDGTDIKINGTYQNGKWLFPVPSSMNKGRYFYRFELEGIDLDFSAPIYFK